MFFCSFPSILPFTSSLGFIALFFKVCPCTDPDGLRDCTAVIRVTQEKLTLLVVPPCGSLDPKYGLDQCVFRNVHTPSTQKGGNGYYMMCWSWGVVEYPLLGV